MAIEVGMKVKATSQNGDIYIGTLTDICLGMCKEIPTQASIIIKEETEKELLAWGQVHIWCSGLKNIEPIEE